MLLLERVSEFFSFRPEKSAEAVLLNEGINTVVLLICILNLV